MSRRVEYNIDQFKINDLRPINIKCEPQANIKSLEDSHQKNLDFYPKIGLISNYKISSILILVRKYRLLNIFVQNRSHILHGCVD